MLRFRRGSNPGPSACEADVITTTLRNRYNVLRILFNSKTFSCVSTVFQLGFVVGISYFGISSNLVVQNVL